MAHQRSPYYIKDIGENNPFRDIYRFREDYSSQQHLLVLIEKCNKILDKGVKCRAFLADLWKAFDSFPRNFLTAKLHANGFEIDSLILIYSYLVGRKQQVKVDNECNLWQEILLGVPQGLIIDPLLFNICTCDLFLLLNQLTQQVMVITQHLMVFPKDIDLIIGKLNVKANETLKCFL